MIYKFSILLRCSAKSGRKDEPREALVLAGFACAVLHKSEF